jgi:hypothetical protein
VGISSEKRGIRTWAASEEYRNNWDAIFGEKPKDCPLGEKCLNNNYEVGSGRRCEGCKR